MSASSSSSNFPAPAPSASSAPDHTYGGGFHLARASASEESLRGGTGNGDGSGSGSSSGRRAERRRAATLNAPDRKRGVRLVDSDTGDDDYATTRAGAVVGEGLSRYAEPVASTTTASGSSFATPIDLTSSPPQPSQGNNYMECIRPRWQPDDEVSECPICDVPFSFWYRKHHCRKCGRVVCASCSPHRITIPRQYIVRPPDAYCAAAFASRLNFEDERAVSPTAVNPALGGGEEVRLCNPCVPDPNPEPPRVFVQSPPRHRSYHSMSVPRSYVAFGESSTSRPGRRTVGSNDYPCFGGLGSLFGDSYQERPQFNPPDPRRPRPPRRHINERDLCPICNYHFPPLPEDGNEEPREAHIRDCIENHAPRVRSQSTTNTNTNTTNPTTQGPPPLPVRMVAFNATEKDCLGHDAGPQECTICMEEYQVGQPLVRLECLCKFHRRCIVEWFERRKECPVHKVS